MCWWLKQTGCCNGALPSKRSYWSVRLSFFRKSELIFLRGQPTDINEQFKVSLLTFTKFYVRCSRKSRLLSDYDIYELVRRQLGFNLHCITALNICSASSSLHIEKLSMTVANSGAIGSTRGTNDLHHHSSKWSWRCIQTAFGNAERWRLCTCLV